MTRTRWIIFILLCLGALTTIVLISKKDSGTDFKGDATKVITDGPISDNVFGSSKQKVLLIEYGDYQCPGCESLYPALKQLTEQYKDQLTFVFRQMPLTTIHPNALAAATAAESAGRQGKFYEYHDLLYGQQSLWKEASVSERTKVFEQFAQALKLDMNKFRTDLASSEVSAKINRDRATASKFGFTSTPSLMLNGQKLSSDVTFDITKLKAAVDEELKKAGLTPPTTDTATPTAEQPQEQQ